MEKIFKYGFVIKPKNMKIWHVVKELNEDKSIKVLQLQITYNPADITNEREPHDTKLIVQMDNKQSVDFSIVQLEKAIYSWENGEIMTIFDENNNITDLKHISRKGAQNGK